MTPDDELLKRVAALADEIKKEFGDEGALVLMIGGSEGEAHSFRRWAWRGRCLQVEGLLARCSEEIRRDLWKDQK